jgi:hypothetical protein
MLKTNQNQVKHRPPQKSLNPQIKINLTTHKKQSITIFGKKKHNKIRKQNYLSGGERDSYFRLKIKRHVKREKIKRPYAQDE